MAMTQSRRMHGAMESGEPLIVTALSVEPGNISLATWIDAPVDCSETQTNQPHKLQTDRLGKWIKTIFYTVFRKSGIFVFSIYFSQFFDKFY